MEVSLYYAIFILGGIGCLYVSGYPRREYEKRISIQIPRTQQYSYSSYVDSRPIAYIRPYTSHRRQNERSPKKPKNKRKKSKYKKRKPKGVFKPYYHGRPTYQRPQYQPPPRKPPISNEKSLGDKVWDVVSNIFNRFRGSNGYSNAYNNLYSGSYSSGTSFGSSVPRYQFATSYQPPLRVVRFVYHYSPFIPLVYGGGRLLFIKPVDVPIPPKPTLDKLNRSCIIWSSVCDKAWENRTETLQNKDSLPSTGKINESDLSNDNQLPSTTKLSPEKPNLISEPSDPSPAKREPQTEPLINKGVPTVETPTNANESATEPQRITETPTPESQTSTEELTSEKATTKEPTTEPQSTTEEPITEPQTTVEPTTEPLTTTDEPTTEPQKTTEEPTTEPQTTTEEPTTEPPTTTGEPTTEPKTTTEEPTTEPQTTTEEPTTEPQTTTGEPTTEPPATTEGLTTEQQKTSEELRTESPITTEEPTSEEPTAEQTFTDETIFEPSTASKELATERQTSSNEFATLLPTTEYEPASSTEDVTQSQQTKKESAMTAEQTTLGLVEEPTEQPNLIYPPQEDVDFVYNNAAFIPLIYGGGQIPFTPPKNQEVPPPAHLINLKVCCIMWPELCEDALRYRDDIMGLELPPDPQINSKPSETKPTENMPSSPEKDDDSNFSFETIDYS